jgi:predicted PurR-regulated permease PerM
MKWINNFKFRTKIIFGVYANIALALLASCISIIFMSDVSNSSNLLTLSNNMVQTVLEAGNDRRDFISTGMSTYSDNILDSIDESIDILNEIIGASSSAEIDSVAEDMIPVLVIIVLALKRSSK